MNRMKKWMLCSLLSGVLVGCSGRIDEDVLRERRAQSMGLQMRGGQEPVWSEEMQAVRDAVCETLGEEYWPDTPLDQQCVCKVLGIAQNYYVDYMAETLLTDEDADLLVILKSDGIHGEQLESMLNGYREEELTDSSRHIQNAIKVEASRIERIGDYVCLIQLGGNLGKEHEVKIKDMAQHCREQNELAIAVLEKQLFQE